MVWGKQVSKYQLSTLELMVKDNLMMNELLNDKAVCKIALGTPRYTKGKIQVPGLKCVY